MAWRDQLEPASFRGIEFYVDTNELSTGRRTALHEYPKRDAAYAEDMGRSTRGITFEAYVLGADYVTAKNALLDALEAEGPGELVHPLYGVRSVQAGTCTVRESRTEGGIARFSLEFTESESPLFPSSTVDAKQAVGLAADTATAAAEAEFLDRFSVADLPQWGIDKATELLDGAADVMADVLGPIKGFADNVASINQQINSLAARAENLVRNPENLVAEVQAIFGSVALSGATTRNSTDALTGFYNDFTSEPESTATTTRGAVERNRAALDGYLHRVAAIEAARVAPGRPTSVTNAVAAAAANGEDVASLQEPSTVYASIRGAQRVRDSIADLIDEQSETAGDELYDALTALRSEMVMAVPGEGESLPRIVTVTLPSTEPALVTAYRLYADANRDSDIVSRNSVRHPGMVPGGVPLEVLTND